MRISIAALTLGFCLTVSFGAGAAQGPAGRAERRPSDRIARLQQAIDSGQVELEFDEELGYLPALLEELSIPVSSQVMPFARNSFQIFQISPSTPRALYFSDDVYIGKVLGVPVLEFTAVDPEIGPVFYTLDEEPDQPVRFVRDTMDCILCHDSSRTPGINVPRLLVLSVLPDSEGAALGRAALSTTDRSPFSERWGGWYVTGTHGNQHHLGNLIVSPNAVDLDPVNNTIDMRREVAGLDLEAGANVTDLGDRFDTSRHLTPHSDIVALMVLGHQTHVLNLIARANYESASRPDGVSEAVESLLDAMLFVGETVLEGPIEGTSDFTSKFPRRGPTDSSGRSLRDLDLERRLFRYPLSFLIYSEAFDALNEPVKQRFRTRLFDVLEGRDASGRFTRLSTEDRAAILGILADTKPGF
jgi:hypothetical protein